MISMNQNLTVHAAHMTYNELMKIMKLHQIEQHFTIDQINYKFQEKKTIEIKSTAHRYTSCLPD